MKWEQPKEQSRCVVEAPDYRIHIGRAPLKSCPTTTTILAALTPHFILSYSLAMIVSKMANIKTDRSGGVRIDQRGLRREAAKDIFACSNQGSFEAPRSLCTLFANSQGAQPNVAGSMACCWSFQLVAPSVPMRIGTHA